MSFAELIERFLDWLLGERKEKKKKNEEATLADLINRVSPDAADQLVDDPHVKPKPAPPPPKPPLSEFDKAYIAARQRAAIPDHLNSGRQQVEGLTAVYVDTGRYVHWRSGFDPRWQDYSEPIPFESHDPGVGDEPPIPPTPPDDPGFSTFKR